MESDNWKRVLDALRMDTDPYRNGTDCCCAVHTSVNKYKRTLNLLKQVESEDEFTVLLDELGDSCRTVIHEGCRMFEVYGRICILEVCL